MEINSTDFNAANAAKPTRRGRVFIVTNRHLHAERRRTEPSNWTNRGFDAVIAGEASSGPTTKKLTRMQSIEGSATNAVYAETISLRGTTLTATTRVVMAVKPSAVGGQ